MPKIFLRPNSPEFADGKDDIPRTRRRLCDMPDCCLAGEYRAPKDRSLGEYYWFCLEHVQEYNKAWNYFSGMSDADVESYINTSTIWDRPTRRFDTMAKAAEDLRRKAYQTYNFTEDEPPKDRAAGGGGFAGRQTPEFEALALMGLEPPVTLEDIKARYKTLAKKYHPDHNKNDPEGEELLKKINMAYTILKMAYQKFETLESKA
jgi:hypothetical protein